MSETMYRIDFGGKVEVKHQLDEPGWQIKRWTWLSNFGYYVVASVCVFSLFGPEFNLIPAAEESLSR